MKSDQPLWEQHLIIGQSRAIYSQQTHVNADLQGLFGRKKEEKEDKTPPCISSGIVRKPTKKGCCGNELVSVLV